jgi:hypothetical protein
LSPAAAGGSNNGLTADYQQELESKTKKTIPCHWVLAVGRVRAQVPIAQRSAVESSDQTMPSAWDGLHELPMGSRYDTKRTLPSGG